MASVGALGIGLSVVFGVFLVLLLAELYYLLFWKRKSLRVVNSAVVEPSRNEPAVSVPKTFLDHSARAMIGLDGECILAPPRLLFTIKEETREDLVDSSTEDRKKKAPQSHIVLQVFQPGIPDVQERARSKPPDSSGDEEAGSSSSETSDGDHDSLMNVSTTTPYVTPPSSPGFSTPSSSPLRSSVSSSGSMRQTARVLPMNRIRHFMYESPPSPPLVPMPLPSESLVEAPLFSGTPSLPLTPSSRCSSR